MENLTYHQRCFGWASGHYLADEVDKTFENQMMKNNLNLEENAWEPLEDYAGKIYQWINQLAWDIENKKFPMEND